MFVTSIRKCIILSGAIALVFLMQGCAQTNSVAVEQSTPSVFEILTPAYSAQFGERPNIPSPEQIHRLSDAQSGEFLAYMAAAENQRWKPHKRLYNFLELKTRNFDYEDATLVAEQVLSKRQGNCLSLAILTTALAKLAGIEMAFNLMDDSPVYERNQTIVRRGLHIRTKLYDPLWENENNMIAMIRPGLFVDYFPTGSARFINNISEYEYQMMYYRNMAAEKLAEGDLNGSYWYGLEALNFAPNDSGTINIIAVVSRRSNQLVEAEALYQFGIDQAEEKLSLLKNYHTLLESSGRKVEADKIKQQLDKMEDPNPFNWIHLAKTAYDNQDYRQAIRFYNKAIEFAPYLHEGYAGLAFSYYKLGNLKTAERNLTQAMEVAVRRSAINLYETKLEVLKKEIR